MTRRGSALILSLWATSVFAAMGITQATRVSLEAKWVDRLQQSRQAWYLSWAGLELAATLLASDMEAGWDAPREIWGRLPAEPVPLSLGTFRYRVEDEQARIPINSAPQELLESLPGFTPAAAAELLRRRQEGRPISHLGELALLSEFKTDSLPELERLVTVHGEGPVNLNSASAEVLQRLGLSGSLSQAVARMRAGRDGVWGSPDDPIFSSAGQIPLLLDEQAGPLLGEDQRALEQLVAGRVLGVHSSFFRVEAEGRTFRHGIVKKLTAVLERQPGRSPEIRGWHET